MHFMSIWKRALIFYGGGHDETNIFLFDSTKDSRTAEKKEQVEKLERSDLMSLFRKDQINLFNPKSI